MFSTACGKGLSCQMISYLINQQSRKYIGRAITATSFRKKMSTMAQIRGEKTIDLETAFLHTEATAQKSYLIRPSNNVFSNNFNEI